MNKAQRKAHLKAIKANQKAARKAARAAAPNPPADPAPEATMPEQPPTHEPNDLLERMARVAKIDLALAESRVTEAKVAAMRMSDDRAREILSEAAESIRDVIELATAALKRVDPAQLAEAVQIIDEPKRDAWGTSVSRPRRGTNPVVTLMQVLQRANSLLLRITRITNPALFEKRKAA